MFKIRDDKLGNVQTELRSYMATWLLVSLAGLCTMDENKKPQHLLELENRRKYK
jgi:hypothetical protein